MRDSNLRMMSDEPLGKSSHLSAKPPPESACCAFQIYGMYVVLKVTHK